MQTTEKKIIGFLINTKDHAAPKRHVLQHAQYRKDFVTVYQDLINRGLIVERGHGFRGSIRMVLLTYQPPNNTNG